MLRKNIVGLLICIAALGITSLGFAGIPDVTRCSAEMLNMTADQVNVYNTPDGSGYLMTEARDKDTAPGSWEDATITVTLIDGTAAPGNPVFAYPFEDLWLENNSLTPYVIDDVFPFDPPTGAPGLIACPNGTVADASTDINGQTTFSGPFYAGGHSEYTNDGNDDNDTKTYVMVSSAPIDDPLKLLFNSADINGDGVWNSDTDVFLFSLLYPAGIGYHYDVDFYFDEVNDLSDLVLFSAARFVQCP
jgi:hypothetical protein